MQRTLLAEVQATDQWLTALQYLMQISAHLPFSYTKRELLTSKSTCSHMLDASQSESDLH